MEKVCSLNFIKIFAIFEKRLNAAFQGNTEILRGGSINYIIKSECYEYEKRLVSNNDVTLEIDILFDRTEDDYLYYSYNIFFGRNKLMFLFPVLSYESPVTIICYVSLRNDDGK